MTDRFDSYTEGLTSPATHGFTVTPSDSEALTETCRALYIGSTGDLAGRFSDGTEVTFSNIVAGTILPVRVTHVLATGTTAADIVALV